MITKQQLTEALEQIKQLCESRYSDTSVYVNEHNDYYVLDKILDNIEDVVKSVLEKKK